MQSSLRVCCCPMTPLISSVSVSSCMSDGSASSEAVRVRASPCLGPITWVAGLWCVVHAVRFAATVPLYGSPGSLSSHLQCSQRPRACAPLAASVPLYGSPGSLSSHLRCQVHYYLLSMRDPLYLDLVLHRCHHGAVSAAPWVADSLAAQVGAVSRTVHVSRVRRGSSVHGCRRCCVAGGAATGPTVIPRTRCRTMECTWHGRPAAGSRPAAPQCGSG